MTAFLRCVKAALMALPATEIPYEAIRCNDTGLRWSFHVCGVVRKAVVVRQLLCLSFLLHFQRFSNHTPFFFFDSVIVLLVLPCLWYPEQKQNWQWWMLNLKICPRWMNFVSDLDKVVLVVNIRCRLEHLLMPVLSEDRVFARKPPFSLLVQSCCPGISNRRLSHVTLQPPWPTQSWPSNKIIDTRSILLLLLFSSRA